MPLQFNKVLIAGSLTRDPEVKFLAGDKCVAQFGLAVNRKFKDANGQQKDETTFVDVETWGRTAELVGQYLVKGRGCFIEGRLKLESWEDKATGAKRSKLKIVADQVLFTDAVKTETAELAPVPGPIRPAMGSTPHNGSDDEPPFFRSELEMLA